MTRANDWKLLNIIKKNLTPEPARVLDPILIIIKMENKQNGLSEELLLQQIRPKSKSIIEV